MTEALEALLQEGRTFAPSDAFRKQSLVSGTDIYDDAERDWQGFWARQALTLDWLAQSESAVPEDTNLQTRTRH